ncbi:hypothetical protein LWI29_006001 [Acer saccharum]|uniref:Uncharacterized protein n=1 Tax=Acer saccharum TaxID=4024 RepID=A0AA39SJD0_ACESA|nr:hypothetical protein LWI29_006001 [Acer saccharum]
MCVDGPIIGSYGSGLNKAHVGKEKTSGQAEDVRISERVEPFLNTVLDKPESTTISLNQIIPKPSTNIATQPSPKMKRKKWKCSAREKHSNLVSGLMASPLQRKLTVSISAKKMARRNSLSPGPHSTLRLQQPATFAGDRSYAALSLIKLTAAFAHQSTSVVVAGIKITSSFFLFTSVWRFERQHKAKLSS